MWNEIRNVVGAIREGGGGSGATSVTFNIQSHDPKAVVDEVAAYLKAQGVYV
jgi:hypothetical protein